MSGLSVTTRLRAQSMATLQVFYLHRLMHIQLRVYHVYDQLIRVLRRVGVGETMEPQFRTPRILLQVTRGFLQTVHSFLEIDNLSFFAFKFVCKTVVTRYVIIELISP